MSDPDVEPRLVRISVGIETEADLRRDLEQGFRRLRGLVGGGRGVERGIGAGEVGVGSVNGLSGARENKL